MDPITWTVIKEKLAEPLKGLAEPVFKKVQKTYFYKSKLQWLKDEGLDLTAPSNDFKERYVDAIVEYESATVYDRESIVRFLLDKETRKQYEKWFVGKKQTDLEADFEQQWRVMKDLKLIPTGDFDFREEMKNFHAAFCKVVNENRSTADIEQFQLIEKILEIVLKIESRTSSGMDISSQNIDGEIQAINELLGRYQSVLESIDGKTGRIEEKVDKVLSLLANEKTSSTKSTETKGSFDLSDFKQAQKAKSLAAYQNRLAKLYAMKSEYEDRYIHDEDPRRRERYLYEIESLNADIVKQEMELNKILNS